MGILMNGNNRPYSPSGAKEKVKIAHIINPVRVGPESDLFLAQPVTFETMRIARELATPWADITLYTAPFREDSGFAPRIFRETAYLERSIIDFVNIHEPRKLPILNDILGRLYNASDAEYYIYSNVDIALMPHFYRFVCRFIRLGYDAFTINRRTIPSTYTGLEDIPIMYTMLGHPHPGHDCFVYRRDAYEKYLLGNVCIGVNWVGLVLITNLMVHARKFTVIRDAHLTFHLGLEEQWKSSRFDDYRLFNEKEAMNILFSLERQYGPFDRSTGPGMYLPGGALCPEGYQ